MDGSDLIYVYFGLDSETPTITKAIVSGKLPWSLQSGASLVAAWSIIAVYVIVNAAFLVPYLGDAARYFRNAPANVAVRREIRRQAVDTLEALHTCGDYDRIVVVAHSLGTVVAYDMLRSYFGRVASRLPTDATVIDDDFDSVDYKPLNTDDLRRKARHIVQKLFAAEAISLKGQERQVDQAGVADRGAKVWLVTDFITLGSPLTHAHYLMCNGKDHAALETDFNRRVKEREFPICPPLADDGAGGGRLTFKNSITGNRQIHHGAVFGLTRWTNLFFPRTEILWGDAIGGECASVFGPALVDVPVRTNSDRRDSFFAHILYWDIKQSEGCEAPHIQALRAAINLEDKP